MATSFTLDVSPQMPCHEGQVVSSSSYTSNLQLMQGSYTLPGGSTITNLNLGLAVDTDNVSKVPYLIFNLSSTVRLVASGVTWKPIPGNSGFSYAFVPFLVVDSSGNPTSYMAVQTQSIDLESNGVQLYLLVHPPSDESETGNVPMHMLGGMLPESLVNNCPPGGCNSTSFTAPSGELTAVSAVIPGSSAAEVTPHKVSYLGVYVDETYLNQAQGQYSEFIVATVNGKPVFTPSNPMSAIQRDGSLLFMEPGAGATTPLFTLNGGDTLSITSSYPTIHVYLSSPTSPTGALVVKGDLKGRLSSPEGTTDPGSLGTTYDPKSPFCDFFTGNPLLRSKMPASGCQNPSTCVTFLNPNVPQTAHIAPNALFGDDSVFFFEEGTHRRPVMHPIRMPLPHASMTDLLGADGCSFANFNYSTAATCKTPADCKAEGGGGSMGCCLANPGGTSSGYCYDMDEYFCAYDPTASKPSLKPLQHYYRRTPYSSSTSAHPLSFSNDASASADYHCDPSKSFDDCCSEAIDSVSERTCGYKNAPMCPLGTEVTQIGSCQNRGRPQGGSPKTYVGAVNFTCSNPAHCTVDSDCAGVTKCVAGQCACTANSCGSDYACIGVTCQPLVPGYSYFRGSLARDPPIAYGDVLPNVENCFAGTPTFTPSKAWSVNVALQPNSIPIPTIPGTDGGKITWQGMLAIDNGVPISKGSYYFSKDMAGSPSPGDRLGPTLVPFYKQCLGTDCEADRIRGVWLGGMCCGSALPPGSCNREGVCIPTNGCVSSSQAGNYYFVG